MAIILPDAIWRPFTGKSTTPLQHDILCAHTEVGSNEGSIAWGAQAGNPYAHNYTDCLGVTTQCQDLSYRAAANLEGNPYVISWETEDMDSRCFAPWGTSCGNVPAWTDAQVRRLILDMAWCCIRFNIPPYLIPDTKAGRRGLAYHRQGVPNSPEWVAGSLRWTSSSGKCCPDWRRIAQFRDLVVPGVQRLVLAPPPPLPPTDEEDVMRLVQFAGDDRWFAVYADKRFWIGAGFQAAFVQDHLKKGGVVLHEGTPENPQPIQWASFWKGMYAPMRPEDGDAAPN